jgi:hypothetical protein
MCAADAARKVLQLVVTHGRHLWRTIEELLSTGPGTRTYHALTVLFADADASATAFKWCLGATLRRYTASGACNL